MGDLSSNMFCSAKDDKLEKGTTSTFTELISKSNVLASFGILFKNQSGHRGVFRTSSRN